MICVKGIKSTSCASVSSAGGDCQANLAVHAKPKMSLVDCREEISQDFEALYRKQHSPDLFCYLFRQWFFIRTLHFSNCLKVWVFVWKKKVLMETLIWSFIFFLIQKFILICKILFVAVFSWKSSVASKLKRTLFLAFLFSWFHQRGNLVICVVKCSGCFKLMILRFQTFVAFRRLVSASFLPWKPEIVSVERGTSPLLCAALQE